MGMGRVFGITFEETRFYQDVKHEAQQKGLRSLVLRQLTKQVGELSEEVKSQVEKLPLEQLENLGEALLDFNSMNDLQTWLDGVGE